MKHVRIISLMLAMLMVLGLMAGCGGGGKNVPEQGGNAGQQPGEEPGGKKSVTVALSENILRLDPHSQTLIPGYAVCDMVFDTLVRGDHAGNYEPWLAKEWSTSEDGKTWTFTLQEGVKFHNGEAFNADDVVCTFQRLIDERDVLTEASSNWPLLESVTKVDDYTVTVQLSDPYGAMLLALSSLYMIPDEAFAEKGETLFTEQIMPGTGPWVFGEWLDGQYVSFTKNNEYWAGNNSVYEEVFLRFILEPSTAIAGQVSGEVDAYLPNGGIVDDMLPLYSGTEDKTELIEFDSGFFMYLGIQCKEGTVFADQKVREAFSLAIDRQIIIDNVLGGGKIPSGILPDSAMGFDPGVPQYEYNPEKAKALLAETSYNGEPIVLSSNTSVKKPEEQLLAISEMANAAGFNTKIEVVESATLMDMRATGSYDVFMVSVMHTGGDPYSVINFRILNDAHHSNYKNDELNALISASNIETDPAKRSEYFTKINQIVHDEYGPLLPTAQMKITYAINKDVKGIDYYPDGWYFCRNIGA